MKLGGREHTLTAAVGTWLVATLRSSSYNWASGSRGRPCLASEPWLASLPARATVTR